jgi:hypothetical protein
MESRSSFFSSTLFETKKTWFEYYHYLPCDYLSGVWLVHILIAVQIAVQKARVLEYLFLPPLPRFQSGHY